MILARPIFSVVVDGPTRLMGLNGVKPARRTRKFDSPLQTRPHTKATPGRL